MKRTYMTAFAILASLFLMASLQGCQGYDDSKLTAALDSQESRIKALETLAGQENTNARSLSALLKAMDGGKTITACTPVTKNGVTAGWTVTFSDNTSVTLWNGSDGSSSSAPLIGMKADSDGVLCWMADGEFLTGTDGKHIPVDGAEGTWSSVTIGSDGRWHIDGKDTGIQAIGRNGADGTAPTVTVGENGNWFVNGVDTGVSRDAKAGDAPDITVGANGNWYIAGADTGVKAKGEAGKDGTAPSVILGSDGTWYVNGTAAGSSAGAPGTTPQLKVQDGRWLVSADGGKTWTDAGAATGADGKDAAGMFRSVVKSSDGKYWTFTLSDGTSFNVPAQQDDRCYRISADGSTMTVTIDGVSFDMILVKAGTFTMGNGQQTHTSGNSSIIDNPSHTVTLTKDYWIMKKNPGKILSEKILTTKDITSYPPSYRDTTIILGSTTGNTITEKGSDYDYSRPETNLDIFIRRIKEKTNLEFRLPTEAQWEYAAKGGHKSKGYTYYGTNDKSTLDAADESFANELGICGMKYGTIWTQVYNPCQDWGDANGFFYGYGSSMINGILVVPDNMKTDPICKYKRSNSYGFAKRPSDASTDIEYRENAFNAYAKTRGGSPRLIIYTNEVPK